MSTADDRRNSDRPNDWLFDTLSRIEASQLRHASEARNAIAELTRKVDEHVKDDRDVQADMSRALQALESASEYEEKNKLNRQAWMIALSSIAGATMLKAFDAIFVRHP